MAGHLSLARPAAKRIPCEIIPWPSRESQSTCRPPGKGLNQGQRKGFQRRHPVVLYHQQIAASGAAWFTQLQLQQPLNSHQDFRPGTQLALDVGYAHPFTERLSGLVQVNAVAKQRDRGGEAEPDDSGNRFVFLSPGASYKAAEMFRLYAYYQHPLYQYVNGVQLTARRAVVVGVCQRASDREDRRALESVAFRALLRIDPERAQ